jgi:hypothetical protein
VKRICRLVIWANLAEQRDKAGSAVAAAATLFLFLVVLGSVTANWLRDENAISESWDIATSQTYGHRVDDFGVLGGDGLLVAWVDPRTFKGTCSIYSRCHFVRLASMVACPSGFLIDVQILDKDEGVLSKSKLEQTIVPVGSIQLLEVDYRTVPQGGAILLVGASCSERFPKL